MRKGFQYRPFEGEKINGWQQISFHGILGYINFEKTMRKNYIEADSQCIKISKKLNFREGCIGDGCKNLLNGAYVVILNKNGIFIMNTKGEYHISSAQIKQDCSEKYIILGCMYKLP